MGSSGSKIMKKIVSPFSSSNSDGYGGCSDCDGTQHETSDRPRPRSGAGLMVLSRRGSMYFDEDGDLAHEFYEEVKPGKKGAKAKMKRIQTNLVPQGEVPYQCPRLNADYPVILHQV